MHPTGCSEFLETPSSLTVAMGEKFSFMCRHSHAAGIYWTINGTRVNQLNKSHINASVHSIGSEWFLVVVNISMEYNATEVRCVAEFHEPSVIKETSSPGTVYIQGLYYVLTFYLYI